MQSRARLVVLVASLVACSGKQDDAPPQQPPLPPALDDAGSDGITTIVGFDPASGMHLDDDSAGGSKPPPRRPSRPAPPIGIMLKSEPAGANVFVDGEPLGVTPKYWAGVADGEEHEFAFTKPNYALARYRFVPITSGVLHATLERVASGEVRDAGADPMHAPRHDAAIAPPPTVIAPPSPPARLSEDPDRPARGSGAPSRAGSGVPPGAADAGSADAGSAGAGSAGAGSAGAGSAGTGSAAAGSAVGSAGSAAGFASPP